MATLTEFDRYFVERFPEATTVTAQIVVDYLETTKPAFSPARGTIGSHSYASSAVSFFNSILRPIFRRPNYCLLSGSPGLPISTP